MGNSILSHAITIPILIILFFSAHMIKISTSAHTNNTQYIKTSCAKTTYPELCYTSLSSYSSQIQNNPKMLVHVALNVTLKSTKLASELMKNLSKRNELSHREAAAMADCVEVVGDAVDEIERSIGEMGRASGSSSDPVINDIQTWISAALTDDNTCLDGFSDNDAIAMDGEVKNIVRKNMEKVAHLTSIALALINRFASSQGNSALIL